MLANRLNTSLNVGILVSMAYDNEAGWRHRRRTGGSRGQAARKELVLWHKVKQNCFGKDSA